MKFIIRELKKEDINQNLFKTLKNLKPENLNKDVNMAKKIFSEIKKNPHHKIFVALSENNEILGLTTLLIERKFIRNFGKQGHLEDVVVRKGYESKGIGSELVKKATDMAESLGCYKVILSCLDKNIKFYEKQGYKKSSNTMIKEF